MKRIGLIVVACVLLLTLFTSCSTEEIVLTESNFENYFSVQIDTENVRFKTDDWASRVLCDLVVKIDSLTKKELSDVEVEIKISIVKGDYHKPNGKDNEFTKTVIIPASGSREFTQTIETWTTFHDLDAPKSSDLKYEIISVKGTLS